MSNSALERVERKKGGESDWPFINEDKAALKDRYDKSN